MFNGQIITQSFNGGDFFLDEHKIGVNYRKYEGSRELNTSSNKIYFGF